MKFADMPSGLMINGMTNILDDFILAADSISGVTWSILLPHPNLWVAISDEELETSDDGDEWNFYGPPCWLYESWYERLETSRLFYLL